MKTAFIIFDDMTALDFIGIYDPLSRLKTMDFMSDFRWDVCAFTATVQDDRGLSFTPDCVGQSLACYDLLAIPGGHGTRSLQQNNTFIHWLRSATPVRKKVSVCTGALLLGAAGFLEGRTATTHPSAYETLKPYCHTVSRDRICDDGEIITSGGVTAGIDLGLYLIEKFTDSETRTKIARQMDYPYKHKN